MTIEPGCLRLVQRLYEDDSLSAKDASVERPVSHRHNLRSGSLGSLEDTENVDTKHLVEVVLVQLEGRLDDRDTRVGNEADDVAEVLLNLVEGLSNVTHVTRDVALVRLDFGIPLLGQALSDLIGVLGRVVQDTCERGKIVLVSLRIHVTWPWKVVRCSMFVRCVSL